MLFDVVGIRLTDFWSYSSVVKYFLLQNLLLILVWKFYGLETWEHLLLFFRQNCRTRMAGAAAILCTIVAEAGTAADRNQREDQYGIKDDGEEESGSEEDKEDRSIRLRSTSHHHQMARPASPSLNELLITTQSNRNTAHHAAPHSPHSPHSTQHTRCVGACHEQTARVGGQPCCLHSVVVTEWFAHR